MAKSESQQKVNPNPLFRGAIQIVKAGLPVFPVRPDGDPLTDWKDGDDKGLKTKRATRSTGTVRSWWLRWPNSAVAIPTGGPSGVVAIGVQRTGRGDDPLARVKDRYGELPTTVTALGPAGKRYYLFKYDVLDLQLSSQNKLNFIDGITLLADGDFVIAPPSPAAFGQWRWATGRSPAEVQPAELPDYLTPRTDALVALGAVYSQQRFDEDLNQELVPIDRLPGWPDSPNEKAGAPQYQREVPIFSAGHGLGGHLAGVLGHGLRPASMTGLGAAGSGVGKTTLVHQVTDGLALRSERIARGDTSMGTTLSPVFFISEMPVEDLVWRSLARWIGCPASYFWGGKTIVERADENRKKEIVAARSMAKRLIDPSDADYDIYAQALRRWVHVISSTSYHGRQLLQLSPEDSVGFIKMLKERIDKVLENHGRQHPKLSAVPVIVFDPIQRYSESATNEVEALNKISEALRVATTEERWVTIVTSDTNKASAAGRMKNDDLQNEGIEAYRGSHRLIHLLDTALYMRKPPGSVWADDRDRAVFHVEVGLVKNRYGRKPFGTPKDPHPRYEWRARCGRFYPYTREKAKICREQDIEHAWEEKAQKRAKKKAAKKPEKEADALQNDELTMPDPGHELH